MEGLKTAGKIPRWKSNLTTAICFFCGPCPQTKKGVGDKNGGEKMSMGSENVGELVDERMKVERN